MNIKDKARQLAIDAIADGRSWYTDGNGDIVLQDGEKLNRADVDKSTLSFITTAKKHERLRQLEQIFSDKTVGLKKLAIDKPWMNDVEAINNQYRVYEEMYKNAKNGLYDTVTNDAIIAANETAKATLAPLTLLLNTIRGIIEEAIHNNAENVDDLLNSADAITLKKEDITLESINSIKEAFGIEIQPA